MVTASPPCTEFSQLVRLAVARGQRGPADPEAGLEIVEGCLRIIDEVKPRFWILENVAGSEKYIVPILGKPRLTRGPWRLWGKFPVFLLPENPDAMAKTSGALTAIRYSPGHTDMVHDRMNSVFAFNPLRSFFRAKIPLPLSVPLALACRDALVLEVVA